MTQVNGAGNGIDPTIIQNQMHAEEAAETTATSGAEQAQPVQEPSTAETAEKVAETVTPNAENAEEASQTEESSSFFDSFTQGFESAKESTTEFFGNFSQRVTEYKDATVEALSYESLQQTGQGAFDQIGDVCNQGYEYVATSDPVKTVSGWISEGAEKVSSGFSGAKSATYSHWLPISMVAVSFFTAAKAGQAAKANINEGNFKKAATQILVGASAAILGGALVYQSGAVQASGETVQSFFASAETAEEASTEG